MAGNLFRGAWFGAMCCAQATETFVNAAYFVEPGTEKLNCAHGRE